MPPAKHRQPLKSLPNRVAPLGNRLASMVPGSWRTDQMTAADRGYDHRWRKARVAFLRAHPLCVYCRRDGYVTAASVVDHIVPHRGDMVAFWNERNWQPLCKAHHDGEKAREEAGGRGKSLPGQ